MPVIKILLIIPFLTFSLLLSTDVSASQEYKVKKGDTLHEIAQKYHVSIKDLKKVNNLDSSKIHPGRVVIIPTKPLSNKKITKLSTNKTNNIKKLEENLTTHTVGKGENLYRISSKYGSSVQELKQINKLSRNSLKIGQVLYVPAPAIDPPVDFPDSIGESDEAVTLIPSDESESNEANALSDYSGEYGNQAATLLTNNNGDSGSNTEKQDNWLSVIDIAMDYLGVPYRFGGSSLKGIDCSAFVQGVYRYFSIDLPRTAREQFKAGVKVSKKDDLRIGDLIFFRTYARFPSHVGIYIGEGKMIHASSRDKKVTITSINEPYYVRRYIGAIRLSDNPTKIPQKSITSITPN